MNFLNPIFFWAFLGLIPLIAIYLLKVRPRRKPATAFFLWQNIFQENRATSLFQRFRDLLSLLLMALAFAAIVFALTRPDFSGDRQRDLVLLIDNSASMNAADGLSTRLESAKSVARQIVRALNGNQRCSIATVSNETIYLSHLTDNPKELLDAIDAIEPTSMTSAISALEQFRTKDETENWAAKDSANDDTISDSAASNTEAPVDEDAKTELPALDYRLVFVTDGCLDGTLPEQLEILKVGSNAGNVGIVAADIQQLPRGDDTVGFFFQLTSSFDQPVSAEVTVSYETEDKIVKLIPLDIKPGLNPAEVFEIPNAADGKWFARVELDSESDALADDDVAFLAVPPRRAIPVTVNTEDRFFYENSVLAFSNTGGLLQLVTDDQNSQLKITQGNVPQAENQNTELTDLLVFQPQGQSPWWEELGEEIEVTLPKALDENHPVIRHLDISSMNFIGAKRLKAPPGAEVWATAEDDTPLIYRASRSGQSVVVVNMDPLASDFYFSAWFPVLVYSTATHLAGRTETLGATYPTGKMAAIPGIQPGQSSKTSIAGPQGSESETTEQFLGPLRTLGHYELTNASGTWPTGCSLLSSAESNLKNENVKDTSKPINRGLSPTRWLTLIAIIVIVVESILYQRRKVG